MCVYIYIYIVCNIFFHPLIHQWSLHFSSVQSPSHVQLFATPWITACQASLFITNSRSSPRLISYMTAGKTIALTRRAFVGKVISLLFNMLSRLVITFLPRSKHLLISWLQSPSAVILEPKIIKSDTISTVFPSISHEVMIVSISQFSSVHSAVSDSLWPHGLQHARPPCPSPTPGACINSCPLY